MGNTGGIAGEVHGTFLAQFAVRDAASPGIQQPGKQCFGFGTERRHRMLFLDYDRLREIARESGRRPRVHPNGFVQFDLTKWGNFRLHIWPDTPIPAQKTSHPIHDHSFDMQSYIIAGELTNELYRFELGIPGGSAEVFKGCGGISYKIYQAARIGGSDTVLDEVDGIPGHLVMTSSKTYRPGDRYSMKRGVLHNSVPNGLVATIMEKIKPDKEYSPRIAVPEGVQPDNDFRRESVDEEMLWEFIRRGLEASNVLQHA